MKEIDKNIFTCLIPQKDRLEKCRLAVKLDFKNIDFVEDFEQKLKTRPKSPKLLILKYLAQNLQ